MAIPICDNLFHIRDPFLLESVTYYLLVGILCFKWIYFKTHNINIMTSDHYVEQKPNASPYLLHNSLWLPISLLQVITLTCICPLGSITNPPMVDSNS